jgi:hypothetical protein
MQIKHCASPSFALFTKAAAILSWQLNDNECYPVVVAARNRRNVAQLPAFGVAPDQLVKPQPGA